ncbi:SDR family oxidoreductase [Gordonia sp. VNK21]|uniref:SDR family oxidoreductase n=1 Tax=Gordonia sp. VNK21 TaxID=3382483 RepID=UPI0038D48E9D
MDLRRTVARAVLSPPLSLADVRRLTGREPADLTGRLVLITGASSGIGETAATLLAGHGAEIIVVARDYERLQAICDSITAAGGTAHPISADLTDADGVDALVGEVLGTFGVPDVLVNNAGRSIRRNVLDTVDRFHDYERTMTINYFGAVRLTTALLPAMVERGEGQIVNVVTWGVTAGAMPRFAAYHASKSALAAFGRSLDAELAGTGVTVTNLGFPLVRTPMIAPTADYDDAPALTSEDAAGWILRAILTRPAELYPRYAVLLRGISAVSPRSVGALVRRMGI